MNDNRQLNPHKEIKRLEDKIKTLEDEFSEIVLELKALLETDEGKEKAAYTPENTVLFLVRFVFNLDDRLQTLSSLAKQNKGLKSEQK